MSSRIFWQLRYLLLNWAYSTNHKRISINYFWFVLFAGVVGMVLATIIRLEMAYPGVGILAGDNAQYLSIATAHGVIMVFFMAMPLLFGFLGNFLLPTQLGVHDVAFPRMNSAAFWFLPASLLALCQLVCIDRRYQRMNCFNIRELQSIIRNKFFTDLTNTKLFYHETIHSPATNNTNINFSGFADSFLTQFKALNILSIQQNNFNKINILFKIFNFKISIPLIFLLFEYIINKIFSNFILLYSIFKFWLVSFIYFFNSINSFFLFFYIKYDFFNAFNKETGYLFFILFKPSTLTLSNPTDRNDFDQISVIKNNILLNNNILNSWNFFSEAYSTKLTNPTTLYKIKIGNYLLNDRFLNNFSFLPTTYIYKNMRFKTSNWFISEEFLTYYKTLILPVFFKQPDSPIQQNLNWNSLNTLIFNSYLTKNIKTYPNSTFFNQLNLYTNYLNLFFAQSKQIKLLNNWRSIKIQREGWRCRLLMTRHQGVLFKRYVDENDLIWIIERNAKDLLPGWAMITPFSSRVRYTLIGKTDIGISIVAITLIASMISSANFLITYRYLSTLNNRKMRDARSFFSESLICASWMMIAANPMLILGLFMLLSDRHWGTSFFDYSGGGDTILFQHMFWFFGHPEVYIIIVPCFGITNTLLSFYLRKRISARASLLYSLYTIAFLGFFVWGHHMYMVGLAHTTRMLYSTLTVMISVPAATKIMHWLVTFINSSLHLELPLILTLFFIFYFISGGISGMAVAHTGMDVLFHDTFYVIGHFHVMLAGSLMFAGFASFYFYLPSLFGVRYSRFFAYLHVFYYSIGQIFTVIPMIWLGYLGMPRRVLDYPSALGGWHSLTTSAHIITISGILAFVIMLFDSLRKQKSYIIKTFGVGRYNTRLNFYLYQIARNRYWLSKHYTLLPVRGKHHLGFYSDFYKLNYLNSDLLLYTFYSYKTPKTWNWKHSYLV